MKTFFNWLSIKLNSLPPYLKISLSLPIISAMMVGSFKIAKVDNDAFLLFKSVSYGLYNITNTETDKKEPTHAKIDSLQIAKTNENRKPKKDTIKTGNDSVKIAAIAANTDDKKDEKKNQIKKKDLTIKINFLDEIAQINILYSPQINESSLAPFQSKLLKFCENKIIVSEPIESGTVIPNINIIKLPIGSESRRNEIAKRIAGKLNIRFNSILYNEATSTVLRIGKI